MVHLRICYFACGIVNMYQEWFAGNLDCSLNDIALEVSKLFITIHLFQNILYHLELTLSQ